MQPHLLLTNLACRELNKKERNDYSIYEYFARKADSVHMQGDTLDEQFKDLSRHIFIVYSRIDNKIYGITTVINDYIGRYHDLSGQLSDFSGTYLCGSFIENQYRNTRIYSFLKDYCLSFARKYRSNIFQSSTGFQKFIHHPDSIEAIIANVRPISKNSFNWCMRRDFRVVGYSLVHHGPLMMLESKNKLSV